MSKRSQTKTGGRDATGGVIPGRFALSVGKPETETPDGWEWVKLTDVARLETGHTPARKHPEYWDGDIPWVGIKDATSNHGFVIGDTFQHVTQEGIDNSSSRVLPANTVCLSRTASVGYVVVMGKPMATSQDFVNWVCSEGIDYRYLAAILYAENASYSLFSRGTTHQTIYFPEAKAFHVLLPSIDQQRKIADIVWNLIDKIQLNRQTNQTLEQIAQAIFKSWFVDVEPTRAKLAAKQIGQARHDSERSAALREALLTDGRWPEAVAAAIAEGDPERAAMAAISGKSLDELDQLSPEQQEQLLATAALFPGALVDSESGEIPEGWDNFKMVDLVKHIKPGTNYQPKRQESGIPFVNGKHVQNGFLDFTKEVKYITEEEYERVHKKWKPEANDVVITRIGTLGRVGIVTEHDLPMALHYNSINIKEDVIKHPFIFFLLKSDYFQYFYHLYKKQAVQEFVTIEAVEGIEINLPKDCLILDELTRVFDDLFFRLRESHFESNTLVSLRDALLPKLLSGEIEVSAEDAA
jgi:restriction endonuclease S subunit